MGYILTLLVSFTTNIKFVANFSRFHTEGIYLKEIFRQNAFPIKLVDNCIKTFLNKKFLHTPLALTVEKKQLFFALPYFGNLFLPFCKIKVIFKSTKHLSKFFRFKEKVPFSLHSNVVYTLLTL